MITKFQVDGETAIVTGASQGIGYPAEVTDGLTGASGEAPESGGQTSDVLRRFGFERTEIDALFESGVVEGS